MLKTLIAAFFTVVVLAAAPAGAWTMGDDGLHKEDWFTISFRDVAEDIQAAKDEGKRLVIIYEQRGCVYCRRLHEELLADPEVSDYIKANYKVVQYNMFGDEEVTDLDGEVLTEKKAARKWGFLFTPTIVFLPEDVPEGKTVAQSAVAIMPGAFGKSTSLDMFQWVRAKGYDSDEIFQKFHARRINERRAAGQPESE